MAETYKCSAPSCGFAAPADRMWNLDRKVTGGQLVILCGKDAHAARKEGLKAFRLAETLRRDAAHEAAKQERAEFFARFGKVRLSDAFQAAGNGDSARPTATSSCPALPKLVVRAEESQIQAT